MKTDLNGFLDKVKTDMPLAQLYVYIVDAGFTGIYRWDEGEGRLNPNTLLEARAFCDTFEYRIIRDNLAEVEFILRTRCDSGDEDCFDETQYLVDGRQIRIRNYIDYYSETGQAYVTDSRLVGFI